MQKNIEISPQSERLLKFVNKTGLSVRAFGEQCGIKSSRTMHIILNEGIKPSAKTLDKIINRFPQLNYDWVLVGVGDMIVKGQEKVPASAESVLKSKDASFESINEKQINSDFQLNELTNRIDKALVLQAQSTQLIQNQIMQMSNTLDDKIMEWSKRAQESIVKFDSLCKQIPEHVETSFLQAANETKEEWVDLFDVTTKGFLKYMTDLDIERTARIAKDTDKVAAKIIEALNKNTTSAIDVITEMVDDKPIVYYPIDKETREAIDELNSNPNT